MKLKQLSLFIENKPGALTQPCKLLAEAGINILTLSLADTKFFGVLRLLIKDWENAKKILEENGFSVTVMDVVAVEMPDTPGMLVKVLQEIDKTGLNVEYMYPFSTEKAGKVAFVFRFNDADDALAKLTENKEIHLLDC